MSNAGPSIAEIGSLVGDPGRANMLGALLDGRALTASELAWTAGVTPATASGHLARLVAGRLLSVARQGRHRYFRLASPDVARMLEGIMVAVSQTAPERRATPRISPALREARTCYDHLAGRLGVALADALVARGEILLSHEAGEVTERGRAALLAFGLPAEQVGRTRRLLCRPCLDWSERRPHLAGALGAALCTRCEELSWIRRMRDSRAVEVTAEGRIGFFRQFGIELQAPGTSRHS
jgi:DNA-binding transcriptional ArsR family regulator